MSCKCQTQKNLEALKEACEKLIDEAKTHNIRIELHPALWNVEETLIKINKQ